MQTLEITPLKNSSLRERIDFPLKRLKDGEKVEEHFHVFRILTPEDGDVRVVWDRREMAQIRDAKKMFDDCIKKGLVPYKVGTDGKATSEIMDEFDAKAEEVIFLPIQQVVGG
jgi:hypothetical protein